MLAPTPASPESAGMSKTAFDRIELHLKQRYVEAGRFPGTQLLVYRRGKVVHSAVQGFADVERKVPVKDDTIFRIYSMTKPITSVALMMLFEEGRFQLDDPISKFIPAFKDPRVFAGGSRGKIDSVPARKTPRFFHSGMYLCTGSSSATRPSSSSIMKATEVSGLVIE